MSDSITGTPEILAMPDHHISTTSLFLCERMSTPFYMMFRHCERAPPHTFDLTFDVINLICRFKSVRPR